ncbi:MAG: hypothetical protein FWF01_02400 [Alphaproteobacteria bacterium]|nr:hypothetical protein [Alphaproteobacteria bacterium]
MQNRLTITGFYTLLVIMGGLSASACQSWSQFSKADDIFAEFESRQSFGQEKLFIPPVLHCDMLMRA